MTIGWRETHKSRRITTNPPGIELDYQLTGTDDHAAAWSYAMGASSGVYIAAGQVLYRQDLRLDYAGAGGWNVNVPYGPQNKQVGAWDFDFDTSGGTLRIFQSKETVTFPAGAPDHRGAIDVQGKDLEVRGTEIVIPALRLGYTFRHPAGVLNEFRAVQLGRATGKTNSAPWHGFAAGECLFLGASGRSGSQSESSVTYSVACSENISNVTIGGIANVSKKGWWTSWISHEKAVDGGEPVKRAEWIYTERVYDEMDFAAVLGF